MVDLCSAEELTAFPRSHNQLYGSHLAAGMRKGREKRMR